MLLQSDFSSIRGIPFFQLVLAQENVRKVYSEAAILELAVLIKARGGVIQNLVVYEVEQTRKRVKQFAVMAGGRRWRALSHLLKEGKISRDYIVPCKVMSKSAAIAISLAENKREDLHPADEFEAFKALVDAGESAEQVAAQFGVEAIAVLQRLKLANVAPEFIHLYRNRGITLEHLMAFAVTDDHEKQQKVWKELPAHSRTPRLIRQALTETEVSATEPLARLVTVKAYEKAGGQCRRDLFDNEVFLLDPELLRTLAQGKLEKKATELKEQGGLAWVDISPHLDLADRSGYGRVATTRRDPTKKETARLTALDEKLASVNAKCYELEESAEDVNPETFEAMEARRDAIELERDAFLKALQVPNPEQLARSGALVSIERNGTIRVETGLLKAADAKLFAAQERRESTSEEGKAQGEHSAALLSSITAHRTLALRAVFAQTPDVALAAVVHRFALATFKGYPRHSGSALHIDISEVGLKQHAPDLESTLAHSWIEKQRQHLQSMLPQEPEALFQWILQAAHAEKLALLAFCASFGLDALHSREEDSDADVLARALQIDLREWWTPNASGYFNRVAKPTILKAVAQGASVEASARLEPLKKKAAAEEAEKALAGKGWLPKFLRKAWMPGNADGTTP
jgi:ParB family transcriptional regulator, chromosome partitioning protein